MPRTIPMSAWQTLSVPANFAYGPFWPNQVTRENTTRGATAARSDKRQRIVTDRRIEHDISITRERKEQRAPFGVPHDPPTRCACCC